MNRKFVFFSIGFASILLILQVLRTYEYMIACVLTVMICTAIGVLFALKYTKQAFSVIIGVAIAASWFICYTKLDKTPALSDEYVKFSATLNDYSYLNSKDSGIVCDVKVSELDGKTLENKFNARMYIANNSFNLSPGDIIEGEVRFNLPKKDKDFDAFTYYKTRGIDAIGFSKDVYVHQGQRFQIKYLHKYVAHATGEKIDMLLPEREAGLVNAILLGDKTDFWLKDERNFSAIGLAHVVAVSGMHIAFFAWFIILIFGRNRAIYAIPFLAFFALIVGAQPSVLRSLIMQIIVIIAPILRREVDSVTSVSVAMVLILMINPYAVLDVGFQLSFLATLGIILYAAKLNNAFMSRIKISNKFLLKAVNFLSSTLATSIVASVFTIPCILWYFKTMSLIAPVSNFLLLWLVNVIFIVAIIGVVLSFVFLPVGKLIMFPVMIASKLLIQGANAFSEIPFAEIYIDDLLSVLFIVYLYIVGILLLNSKNKSYGIPICCVTAILGVFLCVNVQTSTSEFSGIRFSVLDVGQGSCMLADYNNTSVMVDCGGSRSVSAGDIGRNYMRKCGYDKLDALILTHMHSDHVNGVNRLIEQFKVLNLYLPYEAKDDNVCKTIIESANRNNTKIHFISNETKFSKNGLELVMYPTGWFANDNERGLVVLFDKDDFELIVTGDLERRSEKLLCENYKLPDVEAYIVGHHGSNTASSITFMNKILPEFAVISAGEDNYYKHPHEETLGLLNNMGIDVHRTDIEGDIVFYSDELMKEAS